MKVTKKMLTAVSTGVLDTVNDRESFIEAANAVFSVASTVRDNVQMLTEFAIKHAMENDNAFDLITYLLQLATGKYGNGIRSETLKDYIEAIVVGGQFKQAKDGSAVFTKASKKTKVKYKLSVMEEKPWYLFNKEGIAQPKLDFLQALIAQVQKWEKESHNADTKYDVQNREQNDQMVEAIKAQVNSLAGEEIFAA